MGACSQKSHIPQCSSLSTLFLMLFCRQKKLHILQSPPYPPMLLIFRTDSSFPHHKPRVDHLLNHVVPIHVMNALHHLSVQSITLTYIFLWSTVGTKIRYQMWYYGKSSNIHVCIHKMHTYIKAGLLVYFIVNMYIYKYIVYIYI